MSQTSQETTCDRILFFIKWPAEKFLQIHKIRIGVSFLTWNYNSNYSLYTRAMVRL